MLLVEEEEEEDKDEDPLGEKINTLRDLGVRSSMFLNTWKELRYKFPRPGD
jgi:hypothetical protein